jgi:hypothetical protein
MGIHFKNRRSAKMMVDKNSKKERSSCIVYTDYNNQDLNKAYNTRSLDTDSDFHSKDLVCNSHNFYRESSGYCVQTDLYYENDGHCVYDGVYDSHSD